MDIEKNFPELVYFSDFIDVTKYIDFKYEPEFSINDLRALDSANWGFYFKPVAGNRIHLSLPDRGGMASDNALNKAFADYLWKLSDEKDSITRTWFDTEYECTDVNELKKVMDYALSHDFQSYSISKGINFYEEKDFNDFKNDLLSNPKCPDILKKLMESVTFDSARENDYTFRFAQNQFISFAVYMDEKTDAEYLHVYFSELHSKK